MPENGRIIRCAQVHLQLGVTPSYSGSGSWTVSAELDSLWTPSESTISDGIQLLLDGGSSGITLTANYPNAPSGGATGPGGVIDLYIANYSAYAVNPLGTSYLFHSFWDGITAYIDGVLVASSIGGDQVSSGLGPSWIPIFNGLVQVAANSSASIGSFDALIYGGWRYQRNSGGPWTSLPLVIPAVADAATSGPGEQIGPGGYSAATTISAPFGFSSADTVVATTTFGHLLQVGSGLSVIENNRQYGTVVMIPNNPKSIERLNADFAAGWWSFAVPQCQGTSTRSMSYLHTTAGYSISGSTLNSLLAPPRTGAGAQEVALTAGSLEAYFGLPTYSMISTFRNEQSASPGLTEIEGLSTVFPQFMDSSDGSESWSLGAYGVAPYMTHADIRANYFNSAVCHPHWSIGYATQDENLYGSPVHFADYFGPTREQYLGTQQRRNTLVSDPLMESGWTGFWATDFLLGGSGPPMCWIGICRWDTDVVTPPASITLDNSSSSAWSVESTSCTLAFGSTITVTPAAGVCTFDLALDQWGCSPYLYSSICTAVALNWPLTNIASAKVYLVNVDGSETELLIANTGDTVTTPGKTYPFTPMSDPHYAGSWAIDNGFGVATDTGADVASGGVSASEMGDPTGVTAFRMLSGRQPASLRFVITPTDPTMTLAIDYPQLIAGAPAKIMVVENGQVQVLAYQNGPAVRITSHVYWNGATINNPPAISALGYKGTVIDWQCEKRVLLLGVASTGGTPDLTTEIAALYDAYEGNSIGQVDDDSIFFLLPQSSTAPTELAIRVAQVNTWREVPPLAAFPTFDRDPATWLPTTALVQKTWCFAQLPRRIVSANQPADIYNPSGVKVTSASALGIAGWVVTEHSAVIPDSESVNWTVQSDGITFANVTPWHGYTCDLLDQIQGISLGYDVSAVPRHVRTYSRISTGTIFLGVASNRAPIVFEDVNTEISATWARPRWSRAGLKNYVGMIYGDGTTVYWARTYDAGVTWVDTANLGGGVLGDYFEAENGNKWMFKVVDDSGSYNVYSQRLDAFLNVIQAWTITSLTGIDNDPVACRDSVGDKGAWRIGLFYSQGGSPLIQFSQDGINFS